MPITTLVLPGLTSRIHHLIFQQSPQSFISLQKFCSNFSESSCISHQLYIPHFYSCSLAKLSASSFYSGENLLLGTKQHFFENLSPSLRASGSLPFQVFGRFLSELVKLVPLPYSLLTLISCMIFCRHFKML